MKIYCRTQFDITYTGITGHFRSSKIPFVDRAGNQINNEGAWNRARNQQRNWETLQQLVSLRSQVNLTEPQFNKGYWTFEFEIEIDSIFDNGVDRLGILKTDCIDVPMLIGLDETTTSDIALIPEQNIWFKIIE